MPEIKQRIPTEQEQVVLSGVMGAFNNTLDLFEMPHEIRLAILTTMVVSSVQALSKSNHDSAVAVFEKHIEIYKQVRATATYEELVALIESIQLASQGRKPS